MSSLIDILAVLEQIAPESAALPNDPVGLLIDGNQCDSVKVGVCLDATPEVSQRAVAAGIGLLIAHHPLIYQPLKRIHGNVDPIAQSVMTLIRGGVALYAMHTNWDAAPGGINDTLAETLGLLNIRQLGGSGEQALPRLGELPVPMPSVEFARLVETRLDCIGTSTLRCSESIPGQMISCVGVCGGAGASLAAEMQAAGAEAFVTSDVRHHEFLDAAGRGLTLLDAGHQATETPGMRALPHRLLTALPDLEVVWSG